MKIPITRAHFDEQELEAVRRVLESGWVVQGPQVMEFERRFREFTGSAHAIAVSSCTTALHVSLAALGIGSGDEVLVPAFTWVATANAVEYVGAKPVFVDIDLATYNMDPERMRAAVTGKTRAIIPVHLFGAPAPMEEVCACAASNGLHIVEDAACGFGARHRGSHVGMLGALGCFSFHPRKAITTGEGGMILTQDDRLAAVCRSLRDHGATTSDLARHTGKGSFLLTEFRTVGFNFRMTDIQGAIGVAQMEKAEKIQQARVERARRYDRLLRNIPWLRTPSAPEGDTHGYQSYVTLYAPDVPTLERIAELHDGRNRLMSALEEDGIATRQGTHAVTTLHVYREKYGVRPEDYPKALLADRLTLTLPLYAGMTDGEQDAVVEHLIRHYEQARSAA